ncbi:MAG: crossover junction endodeoxyribonuclease RuvC [Alphaproteobacteria bacterium]|nr:MAG: crossover junction endodeoxyribonuclease RuvC [Alphaproteobacteria bacterium]
MIGLDPGLQRTGWGVIEADGRRLRHIANGTVASAPKSDLAERLCELHAALSAVMAAYRPAAAAVEETFVNKNPHSTLKLGQARGIALLVPAAAGIRVAEYTPNHVKKSVVGTGHAHKTQIHAMVSMLLPGVAIAGADAADALAVAICHAHHLGAPGRLRAGGGGARSMG